MVYKEKAMKKILVPTDFSNEANYALDLAHDLAKKEGAEVLLIHIVEVPASYGFSSMGEVYSNLSMEDAYTVQLLKKTKEKLQKVVNDDKYADIVLNAEVFMGNTFDNISKQITENEMDLVVMGTTGISGLDEVFVGSNTERVVRTAKCPVITVKQPIDVSNINSILFASSLLDDRENVMEQLKKLQGTLGAHLHVVKVVTPNNFDRQKDLNERIADFEKKYMLKDCTFHVYNDVTIEEGILNSAQDIDAGIIAMGTNGRTGLTHLLSGSLAEDVANHAHRPVWTYSFNS